MSIDLATAKLMQTALTASGETLLALLQDTPEEVLAAALKNPSLSENHLLVILQRKHLSEELLKQVVRSGAGDQSHRVAYAIACHPATPAHQLSLILPRLFLFELLNICLLPHTVPDQKLAAERVIIQRLPTTPLGNRMTLARRATPPILEALLREGDSRLMEICLTNPQLKEGAVYQFLRSGTASAEVISQVARHPRWHNRPNIREAVLTNPRTPLVWFNLWLPAMKPAEIRKLLNSNRLSPLQKKLVEARLRNQ